jgi:hypothetical protein
MADLRDFYRRELRRLNANTKRLANPEKLATDINKRLAREGVGGMRFTTAIIANRFKTQSDGAGNRWRSLKLKTIQERRRLGFPGASPILRRTSTLANAAAHGKVSADAEKIIHTMKNPLAPVYRRPGKKAKRKKKGGSKPRPRISVYAPSLNAIRPWMNRPTLRELGPLLKRRNELLNAVWLAIRDNRPIGGLL